VFDIIAAGGWLMLPIVVCSGLAMAIILERFWTLRRSAVMPAELLNQNWDWARSKQLQQKHLDALEANSPLGRLLAAALKNRHRSREIIKEAVEDRGRHVVHELERFLNSLGTIAGITPLLGLLGTVVGMIKVFAAIMAEGVGDASNLAGGISEALITTAAGLSVAIPSFLFYRYFTGRVSELVVAMEQEAMRLLETLDQAPPAQRSATPARKKAG
jgi:biopolymer transport protein ExbB